MTGADIVSALLRAYAPLTAIVPPDRIKAGALPESIGLPALLVRTVSSIDRQPLKRGTWVRLTDRVAVTVRASNYREQKAVIALVRKACAGQTGNLAGAMRVAILTSGLGPDVLGPGNSFEQTQDFRASFDAQD